LGAGGAANAAAAAEAADIEEEGPPLPAVKAPSIRSSTMFCPPFSGQAGRQAGRARQAGQGRAGQARQAHDCDAPRRDATQCPTAPEEEREGELVAATE
jgi:hypothetical protein